MLQDQAAKHGVYYSTDKIYPTEMVTKKPINSWEDFTKLKIRSSGAMQTFLTDAGAAASYLPGSELYTALSTGVVDAAHWGASQGAASMGLYDLAKYHVQPALNIAGTDVFIVSQKALDKLPKDIRDIVIQALDEQFWARTNEYLYQERIALAKNRRRAADLLPPRLRRLPSGQTLARIRAASLSRRAGRSRMPPRCGLAHSRYSR